MLDVKDLRFRRPGGQEFSYYFTLEAGHILAVQGVSGVGKTTLLDLIAGFETPDSGTISWMGRPFSASSPWERPVTTVFQDDNLFAHLTCRQNVALGLALPESRETDIDAAFESLGIGGLQSRYPDEISGGQQQRVALARALLRDRPVLLLDESFSALDWNTRQDCFDALQELATTRGMAVLIVSHDERDAAYLGCHVMTLAVPADSPSPTTR